MYNHTQTYVAMNFEIFVLLLCYIIDIVYRSFAFIITKDFHHIISDCMGKIAIEHTDMTTASNLNLGIGFKFSTSEQYAQFMILFLNLNNFVILE